MPLTISAAARLAARAPTNILLALTQDDRVVLLSLRGTLNGWKATRTIGISPTASAGCARLEGEAYGLLFLPPGSSSWLPLYPKYVTEDTRQLAHILVVQ